jgi:hypothetical protein
MMDPLLCQDPADNYIEPSHITKGISWPAHLVMTTGRKQWERKKSEPRKNNGTSEDRKKVSVRKTILTTKLPVLLLVYNSIIYIYTILFGLTLNEV